MDSIANCIGTTIGPRKMHSCMSCQPPVRCKGLEQQGYPGEIVYDERGPA